MEREHLRGERDGERAGVRGEWRAGERDGESGRGGE